MERKDEQTEEILNNLANEHIKNNKVKNAKSKVEKIIIILVIIIIIIVLSILILKNMTNVNSQHNQIKNVLQPYEIEPDEVKKPIIYLYPTVDTELTIKLGNPEKVTCSYPKYDNEWNVIAKPDGTLMDIKTGRKLYALYWEGKEVNNTETKEGFIVEGKDTIEFLEEKLQILGLTDREAEEFIIYWLPKLQENKYNYIRFVTLDEINEYMPLEFSIQPDTLIRVLMEFKALDEYIDIPEQKLETPERNGFVAVEWGGTEIK